MKRFPVLKRRRFLHLLGSGWLGGWSLEAGRPLLPSVSTFSIVGRDPLTGDLGVAVQSKFFGVGSVVPWAQAGVGAVATQAWADTTLGPRSLKALALGESPSELLPSLLATDPQASSRQVGLVDSQGRAMAHTGEDCHDHAGHFTAQDVSIQGNLLAGPQVLEAMRKDWEEFADQEPGCLPDRLFSALEAGQEAGGDRRGRQSAALLVVRQGGGYGGFNDRFVDLRVEDHPTPIQELRRLLELHKQFYRQAHARPPRRIP